MTMQMTSRGANFPRDVYKLTFPENLSPTEKLAKAQDFSMKLQNSGINAVPKEVLGVGEVIITIDGLYEYTQETPNMDLGAVGDLELLRNDVIASLFIPRNLIDSNDSGFGDSGVSLAEKFKVYARLVFRAQTLILEQIAQMDKIHMLYSGEFDPDDIEAPNPVANAIQQMKGTAGTDAQNVTAQVEQNGTQAPVATSQIVPGGHSGHGLTPPSTYL
jgi:hypothetical protein